MNFNLLDAASHEAGTREMNILYFNAETRVITN